MSYDLYVKKPQGDVVTQLQLLPCEENSARVAKKFVELVHGRRERDGNPPPSEYDHFIDDEKKRMESLGLCPYHPNLSLLPPGSWFLQFEFTLDKPWISKDDEPFYVAESVNPVRKDKVFKVPMMSAASWKGLLRWTLMHTLLALKKDELETDDFAQERFGQTLLFGDEKGEEPGGTKDFAAYLDTLNPEARPEYERLLRAYYELEPDDPLPHHSGRLMFYPTFFNQIDVEVINPHSRKTKAGTHPIYLECVPAGAKGTFSLLYVPFDLIGKDERKIRKQALDDLQLVARGLKEMFLTYGFSAKRTSGYGVAEDNLAKPGKLLIRADLPADTTTNPDTDRLQSQTAGDEARRLQADIEQFLKRFNLTEFPRWTNDELEKSGWDGKWQSEYKRLRARHPAWDDATQTWREATTEMPAEPELTPPEKPPVAEYTFRTLGELCRVAQRALKN